MKKLLSVLLSVVFVFALIGCGTAEKEYVYTEYRTLDINKVNADSLDIFFSTTITTDEDKFIIYDFYVPNKYFCAPSDSNKYTTVDLSNWKKFKNHKIALIEREIKEIRVYSDLVIIISQLTIQTNLAIDLTGLDYSNLPDEPVLKSAGEIQQNLIDRKDVIFRDKITIPLSLYNN